jgi:hypothetical protein
MKRDGFDPLVYEAQRKFRYWSEAARPIIARVLREFPQKLNGLQYRADNPQSDESGFKIVTLTTNPDNSYTRDYFDDVYQQPTWNPFSKIDTIDGEIIDHLKKVYAHNAFPRVDNPRRNKLLSELKNRTGIDVKKEIQTQVKNVRKADEKRALELRAETEQQLFGPFRRLFRF